MFTKIKNYFINIHKQVSTWIGYATLVLILVLTMLMPNYLIGFSIVMLITISVLLIAFPERYVSSQVKKFLKWLGKKLNEIE